MSADFHVRWSAAGRGGRIYGSPDIGDVVGWRLGFGLVLRDLWDRVICEEFMVGRTIIVLDGMEFRYLGPPEGSVVAEWAPVERVWKRWPRATLVVDRLSATSPPTAEFCAEGPEDVYWDSCGDDHEDEI